MAKKKVAPAIDYGLLAAEMVKALQLPPGTVVNTNNQQLMRRGDVRGMGMTPRPLVPGGWVDPLVPFGPGKPVFPAAIDPLEPDTGRPQPRRFEYPVSFNLPGGGDRLIPWTMLRQLSDGVDILRNCIEVRKSHIIALDWNVVVSQIAVEQALLGVADTKSDIARVKAAIGGDPQAKADLNTKNGPTKKSVEQALRIEHAGDIARLREWWSKPDRINDWSFEDWLAVALEEYLVLDALTIYPHPGMAGQLHSLEIIAGDTIKPLLDHRGATPAPPQPAYQQILQGFPRGEYKASNYADDEFAQDTLLYRPRHRRANSPYGYSPVEKAILSADLYMKRYHWLRSEYTDGVTPEMLIETDTPFTPEQLYAYERIFNDGLAGQTADRHRARFLPAGMKPAAIGSFEERYRPEFDVHLIRLIAQAMDVMPTELGFPPDGGLGGKGMSEGEENTTYRKATRPTTNWLTSIINQISYQWLTMPSVLTFQFSGLESEDEAAAMTVMEQLFRNAGMTVNEMRDETGRPRFVTPEADMPMIITNREALPLEGLLERAETVAAGGFAEPPPGGKPASQPKQPAPAGKIAEKQAFRNFVKKVKAGERPWRTFTFEQIPEDAALVLNKLAQSGEFDAALMALEVMQ